MSALLDEMKFVADPLADAAVAKIVGDWSLDTLASPALMQTNADRFARIRQANRLMASWTSNAAVMNWQVPAGEFDPQVVEALKEYLAAGAQLPPWADTEKIARAEHIFYDDGPLSCILLFCASLPECYVIPDLADVLHIAGQLEKHTEYRIRSTAAMIFPVMMHGGLTQPDGSGIAQTLKVRLIHATIRNLILRGNPQTLQRNGLHTVAPLLDVDHAQDMYGALIAHGWNIPALGLPCNQEELAYTLLTFNYVFLRSLHILRIPLQAQDENAYLHTWNVMAHVLGVRDTLMVHTMTDAQTLFTQMQARGRAQVRDPDVRKKLGSALIATMKNAIKLPVVKHFPALMTRYLCGRQTAADIGVTKSAPLVAQLAFAIVMVVTRTIDTLVRLALPQFSLSRMLTRILGYHLISKVLLDQTRPLKLPDQLLGRVNDMMDRWGSDTKAPRWVNRVEDWATVRGSWRGATNANHKP